MLLVAVLNSDDDRGIVPYASQICELFKRRRNEAAIGVMSSRYYELANAYDRLGEYEKAAEAMDTKVCWDGATKTITITK